MPPPRAPAPFIVGCGRSGTTLLRTMLDAHPDLAVPPEGHFVPALATQRPFRRGDIDVDEFLRVLGDNRWYRSWGLDDAVVREQLLRRRPLDLGAGLRTLHEAYADARHKGRWGHKTPQIVLNMRAVLAVLPEARFVHLIRDGRDVAVSIQRVDFGPDDIAAAASSWRRNVARGRRAGRRLGDETYLEVRYEALVDDPDEVLRTICGFVDLDFDPAMLSFQEHAERVLADVGRRAQHERVGDPLRRSSEGWDGLPAGDREVVEAIQGGLLHQLSYRTEPPAPLDRLRGARRHALIEARRLAKRFRS